MDPSSERYWIESELCARLDAQRLVAELRRVVALRHEHVLAVEEVGIADGGVYFVTPIVDGITLRTWLERERPLAILESVRVMTEVTLALVHAHAAGIAHGALSPEMILWSNTHAKVRDFGLKAALLHAGAPPEFVDGCAPPGTSDYAAPERSSDALGDIYSFGAIAYEVLTGRVPVLPSLEPVNKLRQHLPAGLARLVMRCLERDPASRPQRADELTRVLVGMVTLALGYERAQLIAQAQFFERHGDAQRAAERFEQAR